MIPNGAERLQRLQERAAARAKNPMNIIRRAGHYVASTTKWVSSGAHLRSDEEVDRIVKICEACPEGYFKEGVCTHKSCGCHVMSTQGEKMTLFGVLLGEGMINKIRRTTEHCPIGEW